MAAEIVLPVQQSPKAGRTNFLYSFSFLPRQKREALHTVYAFCRTTDDIVDDAGRVEDKLRRLEKWRSELSRAAEGESSHPVLNQLHRVAKKFRIPAAHFYSLIRGVEMDLTKNRYATFGELEGYCELVASSVGLMCLEIFGSKNEQTKEYARTLGIALQLTNILRDVGVDSRYGRIYIPLEDLQRFNCDESTILTGHYTPEFRRLMEFEAERTEAYYRAARAALPEDDRRAMIPAKIMERIYFHILLNIKKAGYNVFDRSIRLPLAYQFLIALKYGVIKKLIGR